MRLCIVGCGMTGAVTAMFLKRRLPQINTVILEKSRGTGGRMCTSRNSFGSMVDLGAQFISKSSVLTESQNMCYEELIKAGTLKPLEKMIDGQRNMASTEHFICPKGSGSVVKHFLKSVDCEILFKHKVTEIFSLNEKYKLICDNDSTHEFDAVIFTIPVPQVLQIKGLTSLIKGGEEDKLKSVQYCSRIALGMFYNENEDFFQNLPWVAKFVLNDPVIRFCSLDHKKRGDADSFPSLVVHSTKEFGTKYFDSDASFIQNTLKSKLQEILPNIPQPSEIKFLKWRYSQVENAYPGNIGSLVISKKPLLIAGGDGFSSSTFEGCIFSAESILQNVVSSFH